MDRKYCVLVYSNFSQSSINLIEYIRSLPIDFPTIAGLTMLNVDNDQAKKYCAHSGVQYVPSLLIEYYNGEKQKLEREYIYSWISQILKSLRIESPTPPATPASNTGGKTQITFEHKEPAAATVPAEKAGKKDITSLALEMQKSRETDLSELKEKQKPI